MTQFDKYKKNDSDRSIPLSRLKTRDKIPLRIDKSGRPRSTPLSSDDKLSKLMGNNHNKEDYFGKRFSKVSPTNKKRCLNLDFTDETTERQSSIQELFSPTAEIDDQRRLPKLKSLKPWEKPLKQRIMPKVKPLEQRKKSLKPWEKPLKQLEEAFISSYPTTCNPSAPQCNTRTPVKYRKYIFLFLIVVIVSLLVWYIFL
ncbi:MAG: hypothetical protein AAGH78_03825 [Cyanobacteria bacterium P01_H01_bin.58]